MKIDAPVDELAEIVGKGAHVSNRLDFAVLDFLGVFVLRDALNAGTLERYAEAYFAGITSAQLKRTEYHLTEIKLDDEHFLTRFVQEPEFKQMASLFFGGNVGVDFIRVIKKDVNDVRPVFRHQDTCYQIGGFERYSLFIPLTHCHFQNGGLVLYPGSKHFGYLGDAGEIMDILPGGYPKVETDVEPGDVLIMHSATWHESPENVLRTDRVYLEIHIQHIDEPTTKIHVCGERKSKWLLHLKEDEIFRNSRTQRLRALYKELNAAQESGKQD